MRSFAVVPQTLDPDSDWKLILYADGVISGRELFPHGKAGYRAALAAGEKWVAADRSVQNRVSLVQ